MSSEIEKLLSEDNGLFNLDDVTEQLYRRFGGAKGVANSIFEVFNEASAGSPTKERIAMGLLELSVKRNKAGMDTEVNDASALSEEEIMATLKRLGDKIGKA